MSEMADGPVTTRGGSSSQRGKDYIGEIYDNNEPPALIFKDRIKLVFVVILLIIVVFLLIYIIPWVASNFFTAATILIVVGAITWYVGWRIFRPSY